MKTDKQVLEEMLDRAGIKFELDSEYLKDASLITVEGGYMGFVTEFIFDANGALISVKAWE